MGLFTFNEMYHFIKSMHIVLFVSSINHHSCKYYAKLFT